MGATATVFGLRATKFYALGPGQRPKATTKTIPRWFGRLSCIGIGAFLVCWSLPGLRGSWSWSDIWADWWLLPFFGVVFMVSMMLSEPEPEAEIQSLHLGPNEKND